MVVFLDTNVLIDFFDNRPSTPDAERIFEFCGEDNNTGIVASLSLSTLFYVLRKKLSIEARKDSIRRLANLFTIAGVDAASVQSALQLPMDDYEDALQVVCAREYHAEVIITNNVKDYSDSPIRAITSSEFVATFCSDDAVNGTET